MEYFTFKARGGVIASNINYQDLVGLAIGSEILANISDFTKRCDSTSWALVCEGEDDLELHLGNSNRVYIQVKNQTLTDSELKKIISSFEQLLKDKKNLKINIHFHLALLKGMPKTKTDMQFHLSELHNSKEMYSEGEYKEKVDELSAKYSVPKGVLTRLSIKDYNFVKDEKTSFAYFSHNIGQAYQIKRFSEKSLKAMYHSLAYKFSTSRKDRKAVDRSDFVKPIESYKKFEMGQLQYFEYQRTKKGYYKNLDGTKLAKENYKIVRKAYWKIWREWFKYYGLKILKPYPITSYEKCPKCTHPLMANFGGINGIACPDCGYFPFMSLILVCDCGSYELIKKQPKLEPEEMFNYINSFYLDAPDECRCSDCLKDLTKINFEERAVVVPYPLPINDYEFGKMEDYLAKYS